jgi:galactose-1-phosphate uridylyltransferase
MWSSPFVVARARHAMTPDPGARPDPLVRLPDGTVKQRSPLTGTVVWTVPGRAHRPLNGPPEVRRPVDPASDGRHCALCAARYLETPPEKARLVASPDGDWSLLRDVPADRLTATVAQFRRIPNLFEILSPDYWRANHGYVVPEAVLDRAHTYTASPQGRAHVQAIVRRRRLAAGMTDAEWAAVPETTWLEHGVDLFAGSHDLVVARRHLVDGATFDDELAGSGTLTPDEHHQFLALTIDTLRDLYTVQPSARYVAVFQNWLRPAGASFDHLHKQLVAIDEHGPEADRELDRLREDPDLFSTVVVDYAATHRLVIAENDHAIVVAGVGHRYPAIEVLSTSENQQPWEHTHHEVRAVSDLLHAAHAATGTLVPTNEEWHHRPADVTTAMPWRIVLKWRVSTLAGFEGGTRINVNTIDPHAVRDRMVSELHRLRDAGVVADLRIGDECSHRLGALGYARRG